jgi:hypothetical protein
MPWGVFETDLRIVDVSDLPGFHNPFKCERREIWDRGPAQVCSGAVRDRVAQRYPTDARRPRARSWEIWRASAVALAASARARETAIETDVERLLQGETLNWEEHPDGTVDLTALLSLTETETAMRTVRDRLTPDEIAQCRRSCPYHQVDWPLLATVACDLIETHGTTLIDEAIDAAAATLEELDGRFLTSLFENPIKWAPASRTLTDGQHRTCGLFLGGATRVPVAPGPLRLESDRAWMQDREAHGRG